MGYALLKLEVYDPIAWYQTKINFNTQSPLSWGNRFHEHIHAVSLQQCRFAIAAFWDIFCNSPVYHPGILSSRHRPSVILLSFWVASWELSLSEVKHIHLVINHGLQKLITRSVWSLEHTHSLIIWQCRVGYYHAPSSSNINCYIGLRVLKQFTAG